MDRHITYGQLYQLLLDLRFVYEPVQPSGRGYRHDESDTLILLGDREHSMQARAVDLVSVRRHLVDNGLIDEQDFDGFLSCGRLTQPH